MKKFIVLLTAMLFLGGCALTTIKPYKKAEKAPEPVKKGLLESIVKPEPVEQPAPAPVVKEEDIK